MTILMLQYTTGIILDFIILWRGTDTSLEVEPPQVSRPKVGCGMLFGRCRDIGVRIKVHGVRMTCQHKVRWWLPCGSLVLRPSLLVQEVPIEKAGRCYFAAWLYKNVTSKKAYREIKNQPDGKIQQKRRPYSKINRWRQYCVQPCGQKKYLHGMIKYR